MIKYVRIAENESEYFFEGVKTSDISLTAFLRARGYQIKGVQPDGRRTEWTFDAVLDRKTYERREL